MSHLSQSVPYKTVLIVGVAVASVVVGAAIVVFASPESIQFASLAEDEVTLQPSAAQTTSTNVAAFTNTPAQTATAPSSTPSATPTIETSPSPTSTTSATATANFTSSSTSTSSPTQAATSTHTLRPSNTPAATPSPSNTAAPVPTALPANPDRAEFVADITVPDGTELKAGTSFTKTWRLRNVGTSTWTTDYVFEFADGSEMALTQSVPLPNSVAPGETVDISIEMVAPSNPGNKVSLFQLRNARGQPFGVGPRYNDFIYVQITVVE